MVRGSTLRSRWPAARRDSLWRLCGRGITGTRAGALMPSAVCGDHRMVDGVHRAEFSILGIGGMGTDGTYGDSYASVGVMRLDEGGESCSRGLCHLDVTVPGLASHSQEDPELGASFGWTWANDGRDHSGDGSWDYAWAGQQPFETGDTLRLELD